MLSVGVGPGSRVEALDALRAVAMLAGIVLHACAPYMHAPMHDLVMPLQEQGAGRWTDGAFWLIHATRLPLFFVVSGFASVCLLQKRGERGFLEDRTRRILVPLFVAFLTVIPAMYLIWSWGWVTRDWANWRHVRLFRFGPDLQRNVFGIVHLWFLEYLYLYVLGLWSLARVGWLTRALRWAGWLWPLLLAGAAVVLASGTAWFLDFQNSFFPQWRPLAYYAAWFACGAAMAPWRGVRVAGAGLRPEEAEWWGRPPALRWVGASWFIALAPTIVAGWWFLNIVFASTGMSPHGLREVTLEPWTREAWVLSAAATWLGASAVWLLLGLGVRFVRGLGPVGRYLTESSYWVYLTHLVWIGLGVMGMHWIAAPVGVKALMVMAVAAGGSLCTFALVRRSAVGRLLGGKSVTGPAPASIPSRHRMTEAVHSCTP